jgi:hypothetical protein
MAATLPPQQLHMPSSSAAGIIALLDEEDDNLKVCFTHLFTHSLTHSLALYLLPFANQPINPFTLPLICIYEPTGAIVHSLTHSLTPCCVTLLGGSIEEAVSCGGCALG